MGRPIITVLYEDQLACPKPINFGPHQLLLACVADQTGRSLWDLQWVVVANPKKGYSKLRAALLEEGRIIARAGPLCAVFDNDEVRRCYQLTDTCCKREVLEAIGKEATGSPRIVLLENNAEDLVDQCCDALGQPRPEQKPSPEDRDRHCRRAAFSDDKTARRQIRSNLPSFDRLVLTVASILQELFPQTSDE